MNWLIELIDRLLSWIPRPQLISPSREALRLGHKRRKRIKGGCIVWFTPLFQTIESFPTVEQTLDLPNQTLTSDDLKPFMVSGILAYEVRDIERILCNAFDPDGIVKDVAQACIAEVMMGQPLAESITSLKSGELTRKLTLKCRARLARYGFHVLRCALNELAPCSVFRVVSQHQTTVLPQFPPSS